MTCARIIVAVATCLSACGTSELDRAEGGAAGGAATGAAVGLIGGPVSVVVGAVIGGSAGAITGASTSPLDTTRLEWQQPKTLPFGSNGA